MLANLNWLIEFNWGAVYWPIVVIAATASTVLLVIFRAGDKKTTTVTQVIFIFVSSALTVWILSAWALA